MKYIIQIIAMCGQPYDGPKMEGAYIKSFDHEADYGRGACVGTRDPKRALRFDTPEDAMMFIRRQSVTRPFREDGESNRPLTATSNLVLPLEEDC